MGELFKEISRSRSALEGMRGLGFGGFGQQMRGRAQERVSTWGKYSFSGAQTEGCQSEGNSKENTENGVKGKNENGADSEGQSNWTQRLYNAPKPCNSLYVNYWKNENPSPSPSSYHPMASKGKPPF